MQDKDKDQEDGLGSQAPSAAAAAAKKANVSGRMEKLLVAMVDIQAAVVQAASAAIKDDKGDLMWTFGVWVDCTEQ